MVERKTLRIKRYIKKRWTVLRVRKKYGKLYLIAASGFSETVFAGGKSTLLLYYETFSFLHLVICRPENIKCSASYI